MQYDSLRELTIWGRTLCSPPESPRSHHQLILPAPFDPGRHHDPGLVFCLTLWRACQNPGVLHNWRDAQKIHIFPLPDDSWSAHPFTVCCSDSSKGLTTGNEVGGGGVRGVEPLMRPKVDIWCLEIFYLEITSCEIQYAFSRAKEMCYRF